MTAASHSHRTSTVRTTDNPDAVQLCDICGRDMDEVRAERAARAASRPQRQPRIDARTYEQKLCDQERRRNRYRRTGQ